MNDVYMGIAAAEDRYSLDQPGIADRLAAKLGTVDVTITAAEIITLLFSRVDRQLDDLRAAPIGSTVQAYAVVNHGRWLIDCPFLCGSAQLASRSDHRFWCPDCDNSGSGQWVPVVWPNDPPPIEDALAVRPERSTQNWLPGETAADLAAENEAMAI